MLKQNLLLIIKLCGSKKFFCGLNLFHPKATFSCCNFAKLTSVEILSSIRNVQTILASMSNNDTDTSDLHISVTDASETNFEIIINNKGGKSLLYRGAKYYSTRTHKDRTYYRCHKGCRGKKDGASWCTGYP